MSPILSELSQRSLAFSAEGGFAQFSIVHPATSTPIRRWIDNESGERHALATGDYFYEGPVTEEWTFRAALEGTAGC